MNAPSTAERLKFFGFGEEDETPTRTRAPAPSRARAPSPRAPAPQSKPRPASDPGPEAGHRLHGAIAIKNDSELRVTTQPAIDARRPARMIVRRWYLGDDGRWWPSPANDCWILHGEDAQAFARAVAEAAAHLTGGRT